LPSRPPHGPNIVILLCDDLGKYEVSAYGATHIHTSISIRLALKASFSKRAM
jgi:arylsulfatase A-like enzyme